MKVYDVNKLDEIIIFNGPGDLIEFYREGKYIYLVKPPEKSKRYYRFDLQKGIFERVNFYKTVDDKVTEVDIKNITGWFKDCKLVTKDLHFGRLVVYAKYNRRFDQYSSPVRFIEQLGSKTISNIEKWEALGMKVKEIEKFFSEHLVGNSYTRGEYDDRKNIYLGDVPRSWTYLYSGYLNYGPQDFTQKTLSYIKENFEVIDNFTLNKIHNYYNNGEEVIEMELSEICKDPEFEDCLNYIPDTGMSRGFLRNLLDSNSFHLRMQLIHLIQEFNLDIKALLRFLKRQRNRENNGISYLIGNQHYRDYLVCEKELKNGSFSKMNKYPNNFRTIFHNVEVEFNAKKASIDRAKFKLQGEKFKDLEYQDKEFCIIVPTDPQEINYEAEMLEHCVRSYIPRVVEGHTLIAFLRFLDNPSSPFVTLEVKNGVLTQAYGKNDSKPPEKALSFLKKWIKNRKIKPGCWRGYL